MPRLAIQGTCTWNWNSGAPADRSKPNQSPSDTRKVTSDTTSASARCCPGSEAGKNAAATAPASGRKTTIESRLDEAT